ncbi:MAG: class II aldolase/adducin family protein [Alphaproteobacteria bacterium]|nr:class II aldolase/adducin family protein [Alphaproteobacteria bacterium]
MSVQLDENLRKVRDKVSAQEWRKRVDLAACYRLIDLYGMSELSANHVTTRVPGEDGAFLINPHGMLYDQMHASCFIKVNLAGEVLFNPTGYGVNRAGYVIHSAIHGAKHDVDCIIHTHTIAGMAVSAMKCGLLPLAQTSMRFAKIAYHDYEGVVLGLDEQARLLDDLGDHEGMILRNHGLLVVGASIPEAFNSIFRLERACQVQVAALSCNTELVVPSADVVAASWRQYQPGVRRRFGLLEWPAMLRKLDAIDPSYRE